MTAIDDILAQMKQNPKNIRFNDLCKVCENFFGEPKQTASSHRIYKTPWQGDPRINIQNHKGKAKAYQVKQVLLAIEKLEVGHGIKK
ncbi:MAG: toxin HicA [Deltaproteobacteria bacterium]|nr:toxin HicA [Deltaproteobacteria bacterium]